MSRVVIHVGDRIGLICVVSNKYGQKKWELRRFPITKIVERSNGKRIYSRGFYPIEEDDLLFATELMRSDENLIMPNAPFLMTRWLRDRSKAWVKNKNKVLAERFESEEFNGTREENRGICEENNETEFGEANIGKNEENTK